MDSTFETSTVSVTASAAARTASLEDVVISVSKSSAALQVRPMQRLAGTWLMPIRTGVLCFRPIRATRVCLRLRGAWPAAGVIAIVPLAAHAAMQAAIARGWASFSASDEGNHTRTASSRSRDKWVHSSGQPLAVSVSASLFVTSSSGSRYGQLWAAGEMVYDARTFLGHFCTISWLIYFANNKFVLYVDWSFLLKIKFVYC